MARFVSRCHFWFDLTDTSVTISIYSKFLALDKSNFVGCDCVAADLIIVIRREWFDDTGNEMMPAIRVKFYGIWDLDRYIEQLPGLSRRSRKCKLNSRANKLDTREAPTLLKTLILPMFVYTNMSYFNLYTYLGLKIKFFYFRCCVAGLGGFKSNVCNIVKINRWYDVMTS